MPRRARMYASYATSAALAIALTSTLTACTGSPSRDGGEDTKPGDSSSSASAAPPGKYRTLPEPCGAVSVNTLKDMLPGTEAGEDDSAEDAKGEPGDGSTASPFEGRATVTYDTDRRVGCRWKSTATAGTRHLNIDFERVVSYDPAVSDDEQAERQYDGRASKADIPPSSESPEDSGESDAGTDSEESSDSTNGGSGEKGSATEGTGSTPDAESTAPVPTGDLAPRALDGIGDTAYISDKLDMADSGVHRDITLVFRTANVIATVGYEQWVTDKHRLPDSRELQESAQKLAEQLASRFEED